MKKKNIIGISIALGILISIVLVITMVFTLGSVSFQLTERLPQSETHLFVDGATPQTVEAKMEQDAKFTKGGNLLFMNFSKNIQNIEQNNYYVKVQKIVRSFPNKITVYYCEREPVALVKMQTVSDAYYLIDEDLKVLNVVGSTEAATYELPKLDDYNATYNGEKGKFISDAALKSKLKLMVDSAYSGYVANTEPLITNPTYGQVLKSCSSITYLDGVTDKQVHLVLKTLDNHDIFVEVWDIGKLSGQKLRFLWKTYFAELQSRYESDQSVKVYEYNGQIVLAVQGDIERQTPIENS